MRPSAGRGRGRRPARRVRHASTALVAAAVLLAPLPPLAAAPLPEAPAPTRPPAQDAVADSAALDARTARLADQLRCPVCRSQSVLESSSTLAREMKSEIRRRLAEGQSPEEVKAYFVSRYGEWILLRPEAEGLNLVVYVVPPLILLGGGLLVWWLVRRWRPRTSPGAPAAGGAGPGSPGDAPEPPSDGGLSREEELRLQRALEEGDGRG